MPACQRGSWYSQLPPFGWFDRGDRPGSNALGVPDSSRALRCHHARRLGKWFNVTPPGGIDRFRCSRPTPGRRHGPAAASISAPPPPTRWATRRRHFPTDANFKVEPRRAARPGLAGRLAGAGRRSARQCHRPPLHQGRPARRKSMADKPDGYVPAAQRGGQLADRHRRRHCAEPQFADRAGHGPAAAAQPGGGSADGSAWSNALGGYQQGAQADARNAYGQQRNWRTRRRRTPGRRQWTSSTWDCGNGNSPRAS